MHDPSSPEKPFAPELSDKYPPLKMTGTATRQEPHLDLIDGLRAVAILYVAFFHHWEISWFEHSFDLFGTKFNLNFLPVTGYLGVDIFFFISGFCIFHPRARAALTGGAPEAAFSFYMKRIFKIVPSYLLCIAVIVAFFDRSSFRSPAFAAFDLGTHLLFIHNWFHDTSRTINGVMWSLGVEVQFYALFPLISRVFLRSPATTYAGLTLVALVYRGLLVRFNLIEDFHWLYLLPGYLDLFAQGMLGAHLVARLRAPGSRTGRATLLAGVILCFSVLLWITSLGYARRYEPNGNHLFQSFFRFPMGLTLLGFTLCGQGTYAGFQRAFANPVMRFFSKISYNWYLWHQFLARQLREWRLIPSATPDPHQDPVWMARFHWLSLGLGIALATLLTYGFEIPILNRGKAWLRARSSPKKS